MQGRSFLPLLLGEQPTDWPRAMYYRFYEEAYGVGPHEGIRTEDHKLFHYLYGDKAWELYDLKNDPNELHNRFTDPAYAEVASRLKQQLATLRENLGAESVAKTTGQVD